MPVVRQMLWSKTRFDRAAPWIRLKIKRQASYGALEAVGAEVSMPQYLIVDIQLQVVLSEPVIGHSRICVRLNKAALCLVLLRNEVPENSRRQRTATGSGLVFSLTFYQSFYDKVLLCVSGAGITTLFVKLCPLGIWELTSCQSSFLDSFSCRTFKRLA